MTLGKKRAAQQVQGDHVQAAHLVDVGTGCRDLKGGSSSYLFALTILSSSEHRTTDVIMKYGAELKSS